MAKRLLQSDTVLDRTESIKINLKHVSAEVRQFGEQVLASCTDFLSTNAAMLEKNRQLLRLDRTSQRKLKDWKYKLSGSNRKPAALAADTDVG